MIFSSTPTITKNTQPGSEQEIRLKTFKGVLRQVQFFLPPGSIGLVGVSLWDRSTQILPFTRGEVLRGNNVHMTFNFFWELKQPEPELIIKAYNKDTVYDHLFQLLIDVETEREAYIQRNMLSAMETAATGIVALYNELTQSPIQKLERALGALPERKEDE